MSTNLSCWGAAAALISYQSTDLFFSPFNLNIPNFPPENVSMSSVHLKIDFNHTRTRRYWSNARVCGTFRYIPPVMSAAYKDKITTVTTSINNNYITSSKKNSSTSLFSVLHHTPAARILSAHPLHKHQSLYSRKISKQLQTN